MKFLYSQFTKSFYNANQVLICPVYSAGEKNKKFSLEKFCKDVISYSRTEVIQVDNKNQIEMYLKKNLLCNEIIIAMGAGSISGWIRDISSKLKYR